jgi:uncharacterized cupredoxin-like copper-binding protein
MLGWLTNRMRLRAAGILAVLSAIGCAHAHEGHGTYSAGQPGDPKKPARKIEIVMREEYGLELFVPDKVQVARGEQIRFVLRNEGEHDHEFVLATTKENLEHAAVMRRNPGMEHDDPNAIRLMPSKSGEILWRFTKRGRFEFSCLIPGHREDGMVGTIDVK